MKTALVSGLLLSALFSVSAHAALNAGDKAPDTVAAAPVVAEVETRVPVAPKGADKPGMGRLLAVAPLLGTPLTAFGGFDNVTKAIVVGIIVIAIAALALRGEQIAARTKAILRSFEE